jgi:hypothetical protein
MEILNLVYAPVKNENRDLYNYLMRYLKHLSPPPPLKKREKDSLYFKRAFLYFKFYECEECN